MKATPKKIDRMFTDLVAKDYDEKELWAMSPIEMKELHVIEYPEKYEIRFSNISGTPTGGTKRSVTIVKQAA
jgi:hypothetical protein